jgi:PEP-CTERM motif
MKNQPFDASQVLCSACCVLLGAALCLTSINSSSAALLTTGSVLFPAPAGPNVGGALIAGPLVEPFSTSTFSGVLTSEVFTNDPTNPFGLTDMTFVYQILNTSAQPLDDIARMTVGSFSGYLTDVVYVAGTGTQNPAYFDRPTDSTVGISFAPAPLGSGVILQSENSDVLIIHTNATTFRFNQASLIDSTTTNPGPQTYAPVGTPEPSTFVLAALAAMGLLAVARRRR